MAGVPVTCMLVIGTLVTAILVAGVLGFLWYWYTDLLTYW